MNDVVIRKINAGQHPDIVRVARQARAERLWWPRQGIPRLSTSGPDPEVIGMPPHCDSLDGPVVNAARTALAERDVAQVLPYVDAQGEAELRKAFALTEAARGLGPQAGEVADRWFFETTVRLHRAGEGAPYTGLKPAGLDVGPVIPAAEQALKSGSPDHLADLLCEVVRSQTKRRHALAMRLHERRADDLTAAREYVKAALGLQVWAHRLYRQASSEPHPHRSPHRA